MSRLERSALLVAVFAAGALLMALEVAAFRIIGKTFGSALRETTTVIAVFLAAMSAGYWAGGRAGDRWPHASTLVATLLASAVALLFVPWIDRALSPRIAGSSLALSTHAFLATTVLFAFPTLLLAATSPIAVRLFTRSTIESGSTAGRISAISTAGSIAGSLATAFVLIDWLSSVSRTVLLVALGACLTAILVMAATMRSLPRLGAQRLGIITGGAVLLAILALAFVQSTTLDRSLLDPLPGTKVLFVGDSPYHHITISDRGGTREMRFNIGVQSSMRIGDPLASVIWYPQSFHLARLIRPDTRKVLMIGLGGGTMVKQFLAFYPDTTVDAVEVDPLVVDLAKRYFHVEESERLRIHVTDGRTFLKRRATETWDLIVLDAYTTNRYGDTLPPHLVTREYFTEVQSRLTERGIFHLHCTFHDTKLMPALHKTLSSVFPAVIRVRSELIASSVPIIVDKDALSERAKAMDRLPGLQSAIDWMDSSPAPRIDVPVLTDDYAPVDTLLRAR